MINKVLDIIIKWLLSRLEQADIEQILINKRLALMKQDRENQ